MAIAACVALGALLAVALLALAPPRRPPMSRYAFVAGFAAGELAGQLCALELAVVCVLGATRWPHGVVFIVMVALAAGGSVAFGTLLARGLAARSVVRRALRDAVGIDVEHVARRAWLRPWRTVCAIPLHGRGVRVIRDVPYADDALPAHRLDVICSRLPRSDAPVMLYVHGGAWVIGSKREQALPMLFELAAQGWVCVTIDYRLSPAATWPEHIVDVKHAIAWTRSNARDYGGNPDRMLAISGGSAGGHLAALAALSANDPAFQPGFEDADTSVDACVSLYGVLDMTSDTEVYGHLGAALSSLLTKSVFKARIDDAKDLYEAASPIHRLAADAPAFLVLHGTNDTIVPVEVARTFVHALKAVTASPVAYVELPGAQHAFDLLCSPRCTATTLGIASFLDALVAARTQRRSTI